MATVFDLKKEKLNNTITKRAEGEFEADNGTIRAEFLEQGNRVIFHMGERAVTWQPLSMKYVDEFGGEDHLYSVQDAPLEVKGNQARFNRAMPDIDDWFIMENDQVKHQILVQGFQRDPMP